MKRTPKIRKNKTVLNRLIDETISSDIDWTYYGSTTDKENNKHKSVFASFINIIGDKFLILELNIYNETDLTKLFMYMQNSQADDKIEIKEISYSTKVKVLAEKVLKNVREYNDSEDFEDIYEELIPLYKDNNYYTPTEPEKYEEEYEISPQEEEHELNFIDEVKAKIYRKGDKKYWDEYINGRQFRKVISQSIENKSTPDDAIELIYNLHDLN